jgi:hypothetical protein
MYIMEYDIILSYICVVPCYCILYPVSTGFINLKQWHSNSELLLVPTVLASQLIQLNMKHKQ